MAESGGAALTASVTRYRVMSTVVGTALVLMVFVAMPLKYLADQPLGVEVLGPVHGFLYILYLITVLDLTRQVRLRPLQIVAMVCAGLIPFLTFVVERRMVRLVRAEALAGPTADRR